MFSFHALVIRWLLVSPSLVTLIAELNFCNDCKSDFEIEVWNKLFSIPNPFAKSFFISLNDLPNKPNCSVNLFASVLIVLNIVLFYLAKHCGDAIQTLVESVYAMFRVLWRYPIRHCGDVLFRKGNVELSIDFLTEQ